MKRVVKIFIIVFTVLFASNIYALNVEISNIELSSKTDYVEEISNPTIDGTNIDFNIRFKDEEQKIVYKMEIKNNTSSDLVLDSTFDNNIIKYKLLDFDDNTVKGKSTRTIYLELYYEDEIDESLYSNKLYTASSTFKFVITGNYFGVKGAFENPKTGVFAYSFAIVIAVIILCVLFLFVKNRNVFKYHLIAFLLVIPAIVFADNLINVTVEGKTNMEFIEPKRAILDVGQSVAAKMYQVSGDVVFTTSGSGLWDNKNVAIKHVKEASSRDANGVEVQSADSDYKIYAWFSNGTLYFYTDADFIYYNEDSSYFYAGLSKCEDIEFFHTKYLRNANYMFCLVGYNLTGKLDEVFNFKTKNIETMNHFMAWYHYMINTNEDSYFELGELFKGDNIKDLSEAFYGFAHGDYYNNSPGKLVFKVRDNFNASKVETCRMMFSDFAYAIDNVELYLGNNFNIESCTNSTHMFYEAMINSRGDISIDLGDNFNNKSSTDITYMFADVGTKAHNIDINCGKNYNAESATRTYNVFKNIGYNATGNINIDCGDNFNVKSSGIGDSDWGSNNSDTFNSVGYKSTGDINVNLGKNYNVESAPSIGRMFFAVGYNTTGNINIDCGDNFNAKSALYFNQVFIEIGQKTEGTININLGKNFNAASGTHFKNNFMGYIGYNSESGPKEINIDFGENFGGKNASYFSQTFYNISAIRNDGYGDVNIDLRDAFDSHNATYMYNVFYNVAGSNSTNINFGKLSFEQPNYTCCNNAIQDLALNSRSVSFTSFPSKVVLPNDYYAINIFNGLAYNSTLDSDLTIDFSENGFNSTSYDYSSDNSIIVSNINPSIKFKTGNKMVGNTGKTLNEFILKNNSNLTNNNFVN